LLTRTAPGGIPVQEDVLILFFPFFF
jgi:hypothetical protein